VLLSAGLIDIFWEEILSLYIFIFLILSIYLAPALLVVRLISIDLGLLDYILSNYIIHNN
jgi:hypothetical protein